MKKILTFLVMLMIVCVCIGAYYYVINLEDSKAENYLEHQNIANNVQDEKEISTEPIFTEENLPTIDASLATQPLTDAFITNFLGKEKEIEYTNTHPGYVKLINDEVDLIVVTEPSEEELKLAEEKGVELEVIPVVKEGFVFYVNSENPVKSLSIEQIQDIYTGKITNWSEVGGNNEEIKAFQRPENSGSQTGMYSLVMKDKQIMEAPKENLIETMQAILNLVSDYDNGLNSIGYSYYYFATTMYDTVDSVAASKIRMLQIDGVEPNDETIKNDTYPLNTAYYIVINKNEPEDGKVRKLVDAMLSDRGQAVAKEAGYVPVK